MKLGEYPCPKCGKQRKFSYPDKLCPYCSGETRRKYFHSQCGWCGNTTMVQTKRQKELYRESGRSYCSEACKRKFRVDISAKTMAETNRKYASKRMQEKNPMKNEESKIKMQSTLREIGWKPKEQGGNGRDIPFPQRMLANELDWPVQWILKTGMGKYSGYPSHYKLNIANPEKKIAIEVDGGSHKSLSVMELDQKKDDFLEQDGWLVFRFWNEEVVEDVKACADKVLAAIE